MKNKGYTIQLTKECSEEIFFNALCNGLSYVSGYGLEMSMSEDEYKQSKKNWLEKNPGNSPCYEDILMQMLKDGYQLTLEDLENDGDYTKSITISDVHQKVQKVDIDNLNNIINENDDANDADVVIQTVFFDEVIFG